MAHRPNSNDFTAEDFGQPRRTSRMPTARETRRDHRIEAWYHRVGNEGVERYGARVAAKNSHLSLAQTAPQTSQERPREHVADDGDQEGADDDEDPEGELPTGVPDRVLDDVALVVRRALSRVSAVTV